MPRYKERGEINTGGMDAAELDVDIHERINRAFELYPLSRDELDTCRALLKPSRHTSIMVMPTHRINEVGEFQGFRFNAGSQINADILPISRKMFFGITMTECLSSQREDTRGVNSKAIDLLNNLDACKQKMQNILQNIQKASLHEKASFQCMPVNAYGMHEEGDAYLSDYRRYTDSKFWNPEPPEFIGIYHGFTRGFINDIREHKLYIACSGGLNYASHDFYNMILDMGDQVTTAKLCESEEVHWLRKASQRARCKIIKMVADEFGLDIPIELDTHEFSTNGCYIATPTTETIYHDIQKTSSDVISVYNHACNTELSDNGILCPMHPSEGIWLVQSKIIMGFPNLLVTYGAVGEGSEGLSRCPIQQGIGAFVGLKHHCKIDSECAWKTVF
ncbi:hypothetical protein GUITHDRAFT_117151 [Guillardia theta CCMP2712]|uniref:Uncharacterized protein n=1 Tax=Guillardia theta (strain CCMP2712) TaxID=905079 RepID=L1ILP4_GUITC|nr:hypothetical protein GUITHDRAFT_117151 [Guillardia theta CCMP2712]EKX36720.1 hypothetical protein GUITHDRAFT_117151 [Guillardia theta CCMP2712]|eukprot:XP_005823700.1 hypothetical protein GUITHDRAFT_117151 [Guillardia theta CCMP2712]